MLKKLIKKTLNSKGYEIYKKGELPTDLVLEKDFMILYHQCKPFTMTSPERLFAVYQAVNSIVASKIPGDIVECGVWKGGSSMMAALTLKLLGDTSRTLYLYDTYSGMSKPTDKDVNYVGTTAIGHWKKCQKQEENEWGNASFDEVTGNLISTGYPKEKLRFIKGKVEDTIPGTIPQKIALLRLDTDWYESTYHEFCHLYPLLSIRGILILDDYGHWKGAREATDKYLKEKNIPLLLNRIDYTGRMGVKTIL